jgi:hypothetical protein
MQRIVRAIVVVIGVLTATRAQANVFFDNTGPTSFGAAFAVGDEIADDVVFTGSHPVTSFSIRYHATAVVNAVFKFQTGSANPAVGRPGTTVATFTATNLAAGDHVFTMNLAPSQQFTWTATTGILPSAAVTGGWFSVRFTTPSGGNSGSQAGWFEASGFSNDGFWDITTNTFITFQGDTSASFYLQVSDGAAPGAAALTSLQVEPASVVGGASATGLVTLSQPAPAGGAVVDLESNDPALVDVPDSVTVAAGQTTATFAVDTSPVTALASIGIVATFNGLIKTDALILLASAPPPPPPPPPPTDRVAITRAEYRASKRELRVEATGSDASATLTVFVTSSNAQIGTLTNRGGGSYRGEFTVSVNPQNITVRSSAGGSATAAVTVK